MRFIVLGLAAALSLSACTASSDTNVNSNAGTTLSLTDQVALKSATALSLAELAFNSSEEAATAALNSGHLSKDQAAQLGVYVHTARGYRDQARILVSEGQDASTVLESLSSSLADIKTITG